MVHASQASSNNAWFYDKYEYYKHCMRQAVPVWSVGWAVRDVTVVTALHGTSQPSQQK